MDLTTNQVIIFLNEIQIYQIANCVLIFLIQNKLNKIFHDNQWYYDMKDVR